MAVNPRIIVELFRDKHFQGTKATVVEPIDDLKEIGMDETISSIKVYHGPGAAAAPNQRVVFFEQTRYQGRKITLPPGFYPDIHAIPYNFGDVVSSLNFSSSSRLTAPKYGWMPLIVEVFQDLNYKGRRATIMRDTSYIGEIGMNDRISSMRVTRGPNFPFTGCRAVFFQHPDYEGRELSIALGPRDFSVQISNLDDYNLRTRAGETIQHIDADRGIENMAKTGFDNTISSVKILPTGNFNVLVIEGDSHTREPAILEDFREHQGNAFRFDHVRINQDLENHGSADAVEFESILHLLDNYDIIWFTWNAPGHNGSYFLEPSGERAIQEWVKAGGTLWASAMDDNIETDEKEGKKWRGNWLPVHRHPARVVNSEDVKVWMTREGRKTGLFTWPEKVDPERIVTDDHWVTTDPSYTILARRDDNQEPIAAQLPWGDGHYILFAVDTRSDEIAEAARPLIGNALCFLASLAWATSPRQPLRGRARSAGGMSSAGVVDRTRNRRPQPYRRSIT